jgi:energy-coupling factor transporter ATP-binding protein EcfA2
VLYRARWSEKRHRTPKQTLMSARLISHIEVEGLFGLYSYTIPETGDLSNAAILYGDNGVGKSTLLRLVFHLLSAADNRGHRTALYQAEFRHLRVTLTSGVVLTATAIDKKPSKLLRLEVHADGKVAAAWEYRPRSKGYAIEGEDILLQLSESAAALTAKQLLEYRKIRKSTDDAPHGEEVYLKALSKYVPTLFILNADRRLDSDSVADPSDEVELRRTMQYGEPKRINELVARSREIALSQALGAAARWIGRKAVLGNNQGSMNVHSVYGDILHRLMSPSLSNEPTVTPESISDLLVQLKSIDTRSAALAGYEFATHLPTEQFRKVLERKPGRKTQLAVNLLKPYVKSLEGRLQAVEPIYQLLDKFVKIVNDLLRDKSFSFKLSQGFIIQNRLGVVLEPSQLSSGEQQLLLLLCYVLTARDAPTIFMIDEPELSLNIKWQRQLVQSLLSITDKADIQFILASHSMELLAQHRNKVVKLRNKL